MSEATRFKKRNISATVVADGRLFFDIRDQHALNG